MNVTPKEAPVYGGGNVTVELYSPHVSDDANYFLIFKGSHQRHVVVANAKWNNGVFQLTAEIPGHLIAEEVELSAYVSSGTGSDVVRVASTDFQYASDSAHQMAMFLLGCVDNPNHLKDLANCGERFQLAPCDQASLDERLTAAFKTFHLPECWNMMGTDLKGADSERLLHFSARLGLTQLSTHFLSLPGSQAALSAQNHERLLPEDLAFKNGFQDLANLLQYYRKQHTVFQSIKPVLNEKEKVNPLVISTDTKRNNRSLEHDILELEKRKLALSDIESEDYESENMKELNATRNGSLHGDLMAKLKDFHLLNNRSASLPRQSMRNETHRQQARVLEDNLRRIRDIHEGIQRLRELNTKQIVVHQSSKGGPTRLSNSCPALYMTSGDESSIHLDGAAITMRNIQHRRTSLSSNSRSLDSTFIESFNVKIHVNDLTPAASQECLNICSTLSGSDSLAGKFLNDGTNICKTSNIGGTTSKRLAKRANKKTPARRQSWSSLGASISPEHEDKQLIQRRWSLSSLDSDTEEAFCKSSNSSGSFRSKSSNLCYSKSSNLSQLPREKARIQSDGCCEESVLCKLAKQSSSVPSMHGTTADAKENVEPQKTHSVGSLSSSAKNFLVSFRNHPLQKSLSTPIITVEDAVTDQAKEDITNRQSLCTMHPLPLHDLSPQLHETLDCDETNTDIQQMSLTSLIRDVQMNSATADSDEEKVFVKRKKRSSIFFKKKPDKHKSKEGKKAAHQFVVYNGSLVVCDVCQKSFNKKQALKCENCLVVVHDSTCKDQVIDCNKFKLQRSQSKPNYVPVNKDTNSATMNGGSANQGKGSLPNSKFGFPLSHASIPPLGEAASRSSFISINKMFSEDSTDTGYELHSNMTEINSASMESLDEGAVEISDLEDNQVLRLIDEEPETWNATVDKKVVKKLKEKEIKRQETIHELIITEKHHCLTLQIMQKVYAQGMMKELNAPKELVERLFPCLGDLAELHKSFLCKLRERQSEGPIIENIADILEEQFHDQKAEQMKFAYGLFCSQHIESLNLYKEILKSDRKFQNFIKKCKSKRLCKTRGIPECLLLVTQRITKYILVIESLIKAAKENKEEQQTLEKILNHLKDIISSVDFQVAEKEREMRLLEIFNKMDAKATIMYRGKKFKKTDLLACNRKLRKEGSMTWRSPRGKTIDILAVMLSDLIFFLHENNQKLCFVSLENKPGIVSLQKLLVRKKAGQDSRGMYLISSNPSEPEMIELFCRTSKDQKSWMDAIREAIEMCPDEDEGVPSETEEERKLEAARGARIKQLTSLLHEKDVIMAQLCEERMHILVDLLEMAGVETDQFENVKYSHLVENTSGAETKELISSAISSASRLASNLYTSGTNLSRSVSSAGERQSETYVSPLLPKRAETFGGFDNPTKEQVVPAKVPVFKRKLLLLKEHGEMSILPSKTKMEDVNLGESLESALQNFGLQTSLSVTGRAPSICSSPDKQHHRKQLLSPSFLQQSSFPPFREVNSEIMNLTVTPLLMSQGKEQLMQIVELAHHLNTIVCTVSHLSSAVESMKVHISLSDEKLAKLTKEKEVRDRRPLYRPEHQLEELRNLQKQLNHDRGVWQQEKAHCEAELKNQREELEKLQEQLKVEQMDVTHQRELLYRKLDALQKQGIILSPSHNVVNLNSCSSRDSDCKDDQHSSFAHTDNAHPSATDFSHRRTVSYDLTHDRPNEDQIPYVSSGSSSAAPSHRIDSKNRPSLNISTNTASGKVVPLHLSNSATNMQKRQSVSVQPVKQQLPLKLANTHSANGSAIISSQGPQQVLPMKLAFGTNIQTLGTVESKNAAPKRSHSAASSPSSTLTTPVHVRGGSSPALVQTTSPTNSSVSPKYKSENSILHHLKLASDKTKNKKDDSNKEIFC